MTSLSAPIIVVDNDECIGSWGAYRNGDDAVDVYVGFFCSETFFVFNADDMSMLYSFYKSVLGYDEDHPPVDVFVRLMDQACCIRPGCRELFQHLAQLKMVGRRRVLFFFLVFFFTVFWRCVAFMSRRAVFMGSSCVLRHPMKQAGCTFCGWYWRRGLGHQCMTMSLTAQ